MSICVYDSLPDEAVEIRENVFVKEQGFEKEFDEIDEKAIHLVMFDEHLQKPVVTCRIYLLTPGIGEIVGGSQREERREVLKARMEEMGMEEEGYEWYLDLRKYGGVKHAGFGLGFDRMVMYVTGMANIRDVIPFPRTPKSLEF